MSVAAQSVAESSAESSLLVVRSPRDGSLVGEVPSTPAHTLPAAVGAAREASRAWATLSMKERVRRVRNIRDRWLERAPDLVKALMAEGGKSEIEALTSEVVPSVDCFDYWLKAAPEFLAREKVSLNPLNFPGKKAFIDWEARGVVALITPWNYPSSISVRVLVPALLAGNAVMWKPSELAPLSARVVFEIFSPDLTPDLLQLVQGDGRVGEALVDADIDLVSFVGSAATGRRIAQRAAARLLPVSLELGGKNAAIVLDDADLDRASAGIVWGAYANAGQNCGAVARVYVVESVAGELSRRMKARIQQIRSGPDAGELFDVGPVINEKQLARVLGHLDEAKAAGTAFVAGGGREGVKGFFVQPTLLTSPDAKLAIAREETFGPALSVTVVKDEAEAVARTNDSDFGLTASVWTKDLARGERLARALDVGTVTVNNTSFTPVIPNAPWSGRHASGHGTTNSHRALAELVKPKFVLLDKNAGGELWWFPHDEGLLRVARALVGFLSRRLGTKLGALPTVLGGMQKRMKQLKKPVL